MTASALPRRELGGGLSIRLPGLTERAVLGTRESGADTASSSRSSGDLGVPAEAERALAARLAREAVFQARFARTRQGSPGSLTISRPQKVQRLTK
jgi:hypothetical protein